MEGGQALHADFSQGNPHLPLSLLRRLYYDAKPFIPARLRLMLRRVLARQALERSRAVWPIDPSAARPPARWEGWPGGKKFAFILTHDVEGARGFERVERLLELDRRLGFAGSFNFVPEGEYRLSAEVRARIVDAGFEVGVHDLRHDGKLYRSREIFRENARRINTYLQDWEAVGFRSGFMHHEFEWLHDLNIEYDASGFDTDPFEPQPDGVGTIFPFMIPSPKGGKGYVELPYTLAQDSTLFRFLQQRDIGIWKQKLAWIAKHGGMALVNVHPDYMDFGPGGSEHDYPSRYLEELLQHVRAEYEGAYWNPLPKDLAGFWRKHAWAAFAPPAAAATPPPLVVR